LKRQSFAEGAIILIFLSFFARFLGVFFKIPLDYLVGTQGLGLYNILYPFYTILLAVSTVGLSIAVSKMTAERISLNRFDSAYRVFKLSSILFMILGSLSSLCLLLLSQKIILLLNWPPETYFGLMALTLAPFLVAIMSAFRGFFQGMGSMTPTGISMVIEQIGRILVGISLSYFFLLKGKDLGIVVAGAAFGATAGAFLGALFLLLYFFKNKEEIDRKVKNSFNETNIESASAILMELLSIAVPISMGSAISSIMVFIDSTMLPNILTKLHNSREIAIGLMGSNTRALTLINVPLVISVSIGTSIVPVIAAANKSKDYNLLRVRINKGLKIGSIPAIPAAVGLSMLSGEAIGTVFSSKAGEDILRILAFSVIFIVMAQIFTNILHAIGKPYIPVFTIIIGGIIKILLNSLLVSNPSLSIRGAAISTIISYMITAFLNFIIVKKHTGLKLNISSIILKPVIASALMALILPHLYSILFSLTSSLKISTVLAVVLGGGFYILLIIVLGGLTSEELKMLPIIKRNYQ